MSSLTRPLTSPVSWVSSLARFSLLHALRLRSSQTCLMALEVSKNVPSFFLRSNSFFLRSNLRCFLVISSNLTFFVWSAPSDGSLSCLRFVGADPSPGLGLPSLG
uniref:Uncharacterized protein n=1 Tax=Ixodes ricinus TaxID=34613 RepID=A0A6B0UGB7_IXORI